MRNLTHKGTTTMITTFADTSVRILKETRDWLSDPEHWCQHTICLPRAEDTEVVGNKRFRELLKNAKQTCLLGALEKFGGKLVVSVMISRAANDLYGLQPVKVNDQLGYEAVLKVLDLAIQRS